MLQKFCFLVATILILFASGCNQPAKQNTPQKVIAFEGIEFPMPEIQVPQIPDNTVSIADFGAVTGGQVLNTDAFAKAIEAVHQKGGGKVIIPPGIWLTGPITLKSNLELHITNGALVVFSKNKDLYPIIKTSFEGLDTRRCMSPIYGKDIENVVFSGSGVWDGSGDAWRLVKRSKLTDGQWKKLVASGGIVNKSETTWYPSQEFKDASENANMNVPENLKTDADWQAIRDFLRPVMVSIQNSKNIMFNGPTFQNSPAWCLHPLMVENLVVKNTTVRNPWYSQNGDGIDIESCKNVLVENSSFDVGDDAICIKSGKNEDGRRRGIPTENLIIRDNVVYHGHGGVTVGSEMSGGVNNMHVSNCTFLGTDVGLRFKSTRGRGGVVKNIFISDVQMKDIPTYAISFNLYYGGRSVSELMESGGIKTGSSDIPPVTEETPQFRDITISDITVDGANQAILLQGLPEMNLENVSLSNMLLKTEKGITIADASDIKMNDIQLATKSEKAIEIFNSRNIDFNQLKTDSKATDAISIRGAKSKNISFTSSKDEDLKNYIYLGDEVTKDEISVK